MVIESALQVLQTPEVVETAKFIVGSAGIGKLYNDFASPTIKQSGILGAKVFKALTISLDNWAEKRIKKFTNLQNDVAKKLLERQPDEITDSPHEYIIAPAINAYMYSMDRRELRELFANLIANAMLKENEDKVHPGLVFIAQNLHPDECDLLRYLGATKNLPMLETRFDAGNNSYIVGKTHIYIYPHRTECENSTQFYFDDFREGSEFYISNLSRLGVIKFTYLEHLSSEKYYTKLKELPIIIEEKERCEKAGRRFSIQKGFASLTPLGNTFIEICIK